MTAVTMRAPLARAWSRVWDGRTRYLAGAICLTICVVMLTPIVLSVFASVKSTAEAAAIPPTYVPHELSLDSYQRLWTYQAGLPTYLGNSFATAFMTIAFTLALTIPAGYALARFPVPGKELIFVFLLLALIIPYQALLTPIFLMFAQLKLTNTLVGLAILHTAIQLPFSLYIMRNSFESVPRELEEAAITDGANSWQTLVSIFLPAVVPAIVTVALFAFITSWNEFLGALVLLSRASTFTLPLILAAARSETSLGGTDWGMLQAGVTIAMIPCIGIYLLLQKYYVSGFTSGAIKMTLETMTPGAAVLPTGSAIGRLTPLGAESVSVKGGLWGQRLRINRDHSIPHGFAELERAGNLANFRLAAGVKGRYRTLNDAVGVIYPFLDTDLYKWLEAAAWELGRRQDRTLAKQADEAIGLVVNAQRDDGYLNTYVQVLVPGGEYRDLAWGHELYCFGHLIQAAIAWRRALGDDRLLGVAEGMVGSLERQVETTGHIVLDGHPEIEMALVELYRTTGDRRYLDLAARMVEGRGDGRIGIGRFGSAYWQDHARVRDAATVAGHAVRQLYLDCGAVDVAVELGDRELLDAVIRRWRDMVATRMYLTGGLGSRHLDEAFGDPFELPPDRAYAETCAAIASVMLAWRLLLATGDPDYADVIERTIYNGVLPGVSHDGRSFFYVNTLQRRTDRAAEPPGRGERAAWYPCACCPPNVMRLLSSWPQYLATTDQDGVQIHQYATAEVRGSVAGGTVRVATKTAYPWDGTLNVTVLETPEQPWTLTVRIPGWSTSATLRNTAGRRVRVVSGLRQVSETRTWQAGDSIVVTLDMPVRLTQPDARLDAARGCVALERGPLVYCVESVDLPPGVRLEEVELEAAVQPVAVPRPDLADDVIGIAVPAVQRRLDGGGSPPGSSVTDAWTSVEIDAVPYYTWANRAVDAMRIWIPVRSVAPVETPSGDDA